MLVLITLGIMVVMILFTAIMHKIADHIESRHDPIELKVGRSYKKWKRDQKRKNK